MTSSKPLTDKNEWQQKFSASHSQWQDAKRNREFFFILLFLLLIATFYSIVYALNQFDRWLFSITSQTHFHILLLRMLLIFITPIIMLFIGWRFIVMHAIELIRKIYPPKTDENLFAIIRNRLLGVPPLPPPINTLVKYPTVIIAQPELEEWHWAQWLGGPANLIVQDGFAVYLEYGNMFSRVVGPSSPPPFLERYERIKEVVDLRPQIRKGYVEPWTKDGIRIKLYLYTEVQIDARDEVLEDTSNFLYPFDPLAVKAAAEYTSVRLIDGKLQEQNWVDGAWGSIIGAINAFVAGHSIDELFVAPQKANHSQPETPENLEQIFSQKISEQVAKDVHGRLHQHGIRVLNIQLTQLEIPYDILKLRTKYWEVAREKISAQRSSRAEAERIRARELAHAEAQRTMLTTIMNNLEKVNPDDLTESLILSLSGILDQNLEDPIVRQLMAKESFAVLDRVKKLLHDRF